MASLTSGPSMAKPPTFLVQRQLRESLHDDWQNYGAVEETNYKKLESAWGGDRGKKLLWLSNNPTQLFITCNTERSIVLGEDPKEVETLYHTLFVAPYR